MLRSPGARPSASQAADASGRKPKLPLLRLKARTHVQVACRCKDLSKALVGDASMTGASGRDHTPKQPLLHGGTIYIRVCDNHMQEWVTPAIMSYGYSEWP